MRKYWHVESSKGKTELIKQGFSWTALFSGLLGLFPLGTIIWLIVRRLWLRAFAWLVMYVPPILFLSIAYKMIETRESEFPTSAGPILSLILVTLSFMLVVIPAFQGNKWTMHNRLKKGYMYKGEVAAKNDIEAIKQTQSNNATGSVNAIVEHKQWGLLRTVSAMAGYILIIAIMVTFVTVEVMDKPEQAQLNKIHSDIDTYGAALDFYKLQNYQYPTMEEGLAVLVPNHIKKMKPDPWKRDYLYVSPGRDGSDYEIYTLGRDGLEGGEGIDGDISSSTQE